MTTRTVNQPPTDVVRRHRARRVKVSALKKVVPRLPHENDESADSKAGEPTEVIKQAATDLKRGLTDTDRGAQMTKVYKNL